jgi:hypothetical protein
VIEPFPMLDLREIGLGDCPIKPGPAVVIDPDAHQFPGLIPGAAHAAAPPRRLGGIAGGESGKG